MSNEVKKVLKIVIEIAVFIFLAIIIVNLINANKDILAKNKEENAKDKIDKAIKTFATSNNSTLEDAINNVDGVTDLEVNEETGEYKIKVDGQEYTVITQEVIFDENIINNGNNE